GRAPGGLDPPPVGDELVGAVGGLDHADVVLPHVDADVGLELRALVAAHLDLLILLGDDQLVPEVLERAAQRHQVGDLEVALGEMGHYSSSFLSMLSRIAAPAASSCFFLEMPMVPLADADRARVRAHSRIPSMTSRIVTESGTISDTDCMIRSVS